MAEIVSTGKTEDGAYQITVKVAVKPPTMAERDARVAELERRLKEVTAERDAALRGEGVTFDMGNGVCLDPEAARRLHAEWLGLYRVVPRDWWDNPAGYIKAVLAELEALKVGKTGG